MPTFGVIILLSHVLIGPCHYPITALINLPSVVLLQGKLFQSMPNTLIEFLPQVLCTYSPSPEYPPPPAPLDNGNGLPPHLT